MIPRTLYLFPPNLTSRLFLFYSNTARGAIFGECGVNQAELGLPLDNNFKKV